MTTAEIFADYLGLTPENAPWAYFSDLCPRCNGWCNVYIGLVPSRCPVCKGPGKEYQFTATSPLAEKPTPGWASVLLRWRLFNEIEVYWKSGVQTFDACVAPQCDMFNALTPERAMCLAMIDADPDLRARCEAASDWEVVK